MYYNMKLSAIKGVISDLEKTIDAYKDSNEASLDMLTQRAIGYINKLTELEKLNGNAKTNRKASVRKSRRTVSRS